jgi:DNA-binding NarL/FixJ family response regulator
MIMRLSPRLTARILPTPAMAPHQPIRVALVEDDDLTREGLRRLINGTPDLACVAGCRSAEEALAARLTASPDVLLLDIHLPGMSGTDAVARFRGRWPDTVILMLTVFSEEETIFAALCHGASGYLLKKTPPARLLDAIRDACDGGAPISPEIARKVIRMFREFQPPSGHSLPLAPHEVRLLQLFAEGHSYQAAAARLHVSINTVRNYIRSIYEKLHVHSKSEAVTKALRAGMI